MVFVIFILLILATEIEHISAMFQEKQQELQAAVLKVDQLTQQLEDLRKGKLNGFQSYNGQMTGPAAVELKKLYQELQVSNKNMLFELQLWILKVLLLSLWVAVWFCDIL